MLLDMTRYYRRGPIFVPNLRHRLRFGAGGDYSIWSNTVRAEFQRINQPFRYAKLRLLHCLPGFQKFHLSESFR